MSGVLIFYLIYVNVENAILIPRIMRSSVNLMGLTVLVALLLGTALAGVVGALVSVPTAALITVLLDEYAIREWPGESEAVEEFFDGKPPRIEKFGWASAPGGWFVKA